MIHTCLWISIRIKYHYRYNMMGVCWGGGVAASHLAGKFLMGFQAHIVSGIVLLS